MNASLNEKLSKVEWGEYKIEKLFTSSNGDYDIQKKHINGVGNYVITSGLTDNGVLGKSDIPAKIFEKGTITIDMFGCAFYRQFQYKMVTHARFFFKTLKPLTHNQGLFFSISLNYLSREFGYENMCSWEKINPKPSITAK
ncbi:MAG: restriction endonuclease subunit S [[Eubacterium] siraeum]